MNPNPGVGYPEVIETAYQIKDGTLVLNMRAPLIGNALRGWAVNCTPKRGLGPKQHHLFSITRKPCTALKVRRWHLVTQKIE